MGWNVFVTRELPKPGMDLLRESCERMDVNPHDRVLTRQELLEGVRGRDGVLCLLTDTIDDEVFEAAEGALMFANYAVGFNNIDVDAANRHGMLISNTPGVLTETTADLAWALIFAVARRVVEADSFTRTGKFEGWGPMLLLGVDVYGKTLGIVGGGRIGTAVGLRARGFAMRVLYADVMPSPTLEGEVGARRVELDELCSEADFLTVHVNLTPETAHIIGAHELDLMKPSAILINNSRGPTVDEKALVKALREGQIAGAGLDVYENEPALAPGLVELENTVLLPHVASATVETRTKMALMAAENLLAGLRGERPPNLVNQEAFDALSRG
jgi:lactate dehydrogenase-like 2-hydroxyacid dehydrogenase